MDERIREEFLENIESENIELDDIDEDYNIENNEVIEFSYLEEKAQKVKDLGKEINNLKKEQDLLKEQIMLELINNRTQNIKIKQKQPA